ncbi:MAG: acetyltransferase domain protein [Glaciihabitans sp.]|nr:acetyltransferase domain protein [Glaciihabitans sp.]
MLDPEASVPVIRAARATDLPMLYRAELIYMRKIEPESVQGWIDATDRNLELWTGNLERGIVAEVDGVPAGVALWMVQGQEQEQDQVDVAAIVSIHVLGQFRRRGVAHRLLDACVQDSRAHGYSTITLGVHRSNPARSLYERYGFVADDPSGATTGATTGDHLYFSLDDAKTADDAATRAARSAAQHATPGAADQRV